jgi:subtilisin family serine protease
MTKKPFIIAIIIACIVLFAMSFAYVNNAKFYYAYDEKIILNEVNDKLVIRFNENKKSNKEKISVYSDIIDKKIEWKDDSTLILTINPSEKELFKDKVLKQSDVSSCNYVYKINTGLEMGITDEIVVKFREGISQKEIEKLHNKYEVKVIKTTDIFQLLKVPSHLDALEIANKYQESGLTVFSHPDFICEIEMHQIIPNDTYFGNQFALNNTGQVFTDGHSGVVDADIDAPEAWTVTRGSNNIIIAVLDEGVTSNHPDLPNTRQVRLNGSNYGDGDPNNPSPTLNGNHGNSCAGVIAATQNNNQGISGIAPNCRIMPIRTQGATTAEVADAIDFARLNGAHIISCSWGYVSTNPNLIPAIRDAIITATTLGRNGLGCVVVFSASNTADHPIGDDGEIRFPGNVNVAGVLTVGASDRNDVQAVYSPTSNPASPENQIIDIVAPSHRAFSSQIPTETNEVWTIDIPNSNGYNPVHEHDGPYGILPAIGSILPNTGTNNLSYTARFGGTSNSCPEVAAVAALILSINPNLSQQEIFNIITNTADKVGGYVYTNGRSNELGFGRLNANRAVTQTLLTNKSIEGNNIICNTAVYSVPNLPSNCSVSWNVTPTGTVNLSQSNNIATLSRISDALITLNATISTTGESYTPTISKTIRVGAPPTPASIIGFCCNGMGFKSETAYVFSVNVFGATQFNWIVSGGVILYGQGTNSITVLTSQAPPSGISFDVSVRAGNDCGWGGYLQRSGFVAPFIGTSMFLVYPNPTSSEVTVSVSDLKLNSEIYNAAESISVNYIKIIDSFGNIKKFIKTASDQKAVTINISDLPKGIYMININYGLKEESHKLLIE